VVESEIRPGFRHRSLVCRDERQVIDWTAGLAACDNPHSAGQYAVLGKVWRTAGTRTRFCRRRLIKGSLNGTGEALDWAIVWAQWATEKMAGQYCHDKQLVSNLGQPKSAEARAHGRQGLFCSLRWQ
jgi:hypothetical protein